MSFCVGNIKETLFYLNLKAKISQPIYSSHSNNLILFIQGVSVQDPNVQSTVLCNGSYSTFSLTSCTIKELCLWKFLQTEVQTL